MTDVSIRDLRNHGGAIVARVQRGEHLTVTRDGEPVAQLAPLARPPLPRAVLAERWRRLPPVDPVRLRADLDAVFDAQV